MSCQKVENENMEHIEVNKIFTIKCSYSGPEGYVLWRNDSKSLKEGVFILLILHFFKFSSFSSCLS